MSWRALVLALLGWLALVAQARADDLRPGFLELTEGAPGTWSMVWKAPILGGLAVRARPQLPAFCKLEWQPPRLVGGSLVETGTAHCTRPLGGARIGLAGMEHGFTDALLRVAARGAPVEAARLTPAQSFTTLATVPDRMEVLRTYLVLGVTHILTGYDHLLFVLSLVLLIRRGWSVAKTVTAFTLAHSLTLAATTLGLFVVARRPVEICIALSIVFLAVEIVKEDPDHPRLTARIPWLVAFAFGLLHGLGFAAALAEIGLPQGEVVPALFAFNVGVEAGQLVIVAAGFAALWLVARVAAARAGAVRRVAAYAIGSIAAFWMIQRAVS
jgi:hydrogenase/urease accessory protein HupE